MKIKLPHISYYKFKSACDCITVILIILVCTRLNLKTRQEVLIAAIAAVIYVTIMGVVEKLVFKRERKKLKSDTEK